MVWQQEVTVSLRNGVTGSLMREYDWGRHGKTRMLVEAVEGATICPEITIHANFEWLKADGLFIGIRYGSPEYEIQLWIPKPQEGPASSERSDWTFQIPGKCAGSTVVGRGRVYHVYQFGQAQSWSCGRDGEKECPDLKKAREPFFNTIWISVKRMLLSENIHMGSIPQHFQRSPTSTSLSIIRKEAEAIPLRRGIVLDPRLSALEDLGTKGGDWFNTVYQFRHGDQMPKEMKKSTVLKPSLRQPLAHYRQPYIKREGRDTEAQGDEVRQTSQTPVPNFDATIQTSMEEQPLFISSPTLASQSMTSSEPNPAIIAEMSGAICESSCPVPKKRPQAHPSVAGTVQTLDLRMNDSDSMPPQKKPRVDDMNGLKASKNKQNELASQTIFDTTRFRPKDDSHLTKTIECHSKTISSPRNIAAALRMARGGSHSSAASSPRSDWSISSTSKIPKLSGDVLQIQSPRVTLDSILQEKPAATAQATPAYIKGPTNNRTVFGSTTTSTPSTQVQSNQEQFVIKSTQSSIANVEYSDRHEKRQITPYTPMSFEHRQQELEVRRRQLEEEVRQLERQMEEKLLAECEQLSSKAERLRQSLSDGSSH